MLSLSGSSGDLSHNISETIRIVIVIRIPNTIAINVFIKSSIRANMISFVSSIPNIIRQNNIDHGKNTTMTVDRTKNFQKPNLR